MDLENIGELESVDVATFGRMFLMRFMQQGFGSLSKREIEVLVINLLKRQTAYQGKSNFSLSKALKIPGVKLSGLLYESVLLFEEDQDSYFQNGLISALQKVKLKPRRKENEDYVYTFVLEDKFVRLATHARLKDLGYFADGSFNTEIVSISHAALIDLLASFITGSDVASLIDALEKELSKDQVQHEVDEAERLRIFVAAIKDGNSVISAKGLLVKALEGAAGKGGEFVVDWLATGGVSTAVDAVKKLISLIGNPNEEFPQEIHT